MSIRGASQEVADIMPREELATIVDRGWAVLPLARQVLLTLGDAPCVVASAGDLGRRLFPLAAGFERCGQPIPARLVQGLAEAFTELGQQNLAPSDQVLDLLQTATSQLGDLLVELDATGEITIPEPIDTMIRLEAAVARQRMVQQTPTHSEQESPRAESSPLSDLHRCGDALFAASESLLNRVQRDDASPYSAPVSRIHHLASTLRERLIEIIPSVTAANVLDAEPTVEKHLIESEPVTITEDIFDNADMSPELLEEQTPITLAEIATECDVTDSQPAWLQPVWLLTHRPPRVLVIDESPFVRMLLGTAIESSGHATLTLASLDEAEAPLNDSQASDIVIWGGVDSSAQTDCLTEWILRRDDSRRPMLIGLVNGMEQSDEMPPEFNHVVLRAHLPELLSILRDRLGDATPAIKKSA